MFIESSKTRLFKPVAYVLTAMLIVALCAAPASAASAGAESRRGNLRTDMKPGALTNPGSAAVETEAPYTESRGVVHLTIVNITNRIKLDNEDYQVSQKRADIYQRLLANAMHDKYLADNKDAPPAILAAQRVAHEMNRYTAWRNAELDFERYQNDLKDKYDRIKSSLKKQYTDILDLERGLKTYQDEMIKLDLNIEQLAAKISVGVAKESDMDAYRSQKLRLETDIASTLRDIDLAKFNLKTDLKIDHKKDILLADYNEKFVRFNDARVDEQIKAAVDGCFSVYSNTKKLDILREERAILVQWDKAGAMASNLYNNEISIKETEYALINARKTEESGLWSDYYGLLNQEAQIEIERLNLKIAENEYNVAVAKLAHGLATPLEEQNASIAFESAKTSVQTAINNYMRMREDFEQRLKN